MKVLHVREHGKHGKLVKTKITLDGKELGIESRIAFVAKGEMLNADPKIWEFAIPNGRDIEQVIIKFKQ